GQHPGGLVVVPDGHEVYEFTPIQHPANKSDAGTITTHFDFDSLHDSLVKLDILGHDAPTVIKMLEDMTGVRTAEIRLDDQPTMALFSGLESLGVDAAAAGGEVGTLGVPEFGTGFVRQVLVDTRPATFADLVRIMGLVHGTDLWFNNAQDLIRAGTCTLAQVIAARDDIMLYLIQKGLDKGMAFKIMESVRKGKGLTPEWEQAMREAAVPNWYIDSCKKIKYLFPKAHGVAYAIMMFYIAYYKVRYPSAFYAAYFSTKAEEADGSLLVGGAKAIAPALQAIARKGNDASAKEKSVYTVLEVANEACARGISFAPVDVYRSEVSRFTLAEEQVLRCPLVSLPGLGETAAEAIVRERALRPFTSMEDLRKRAGLSKTVTLALAEHGALAGWPQTDQLSLF
ncbi:MAG TPA: PolC-type DNA polymerase III, partial [Limnochordia bacterium]|nr:PolC-type DNA polymerase III [Limnochordia bacterium]